MLKADDFAKPFRDILEQAAGSPDQLEKILRSSSREQIELYYHDLNRAVSNLWRSGIPDYIEDHSDDTQKEILEHIVGQGKDYYAEMLEHLNRAPIGEHIDARTFRGAAIVVYEERFGERIPRRKGANGSH